MNKNYFQKIKDKTETNHIFTKLLKWFKIL
jgi:hypothetical protein